MANKENNEKTSEETIELSVDDLEEASGGVIVDLGDGRYTTTDEFNGHTYYITAVRPSINFLSIALRERTEDNGDQELEQ